MLSFFETIRDFLLQGGHVLVILLLTTIALWTLLLERFHFFKYIYPSERAALIERWQQKSDKASWSAGKIRECLISQTASSLYKNITFIRTIVVLCPLLGLLGTVTGMIAVFDSMAATGTSNARLMAGGISMATIPTMVGMVACLSGLYFGSILERHAKLQKNKLSELLEYRH